MLNTLMAACAYPTSGLLLETVTVINCRVAFGLLNR